MKQYKKEYPDRFESYPDQTTPNAPKVLRLGFHDCLKYPADKLAKGEVSGCDGCLS